MKAKLTWLLALLVALSCLPVAQAQNEKLNIVYVMTDDQASWTIGAYGNRESNTSNIETEL